MLFRRASVVVIALALAIVVVAFPSRAPVDAQAFERIHLYDVDIHITPEGDLEVLETIEYDFGSQERRGILRDIPVRYQYDDEYDRVYDLDVLEVTASGGASDRYQVEDIENGEIRIRIGDPDRTITGAHTYTILYRVRGVLNGFEDHDELYWNAIGAGWAAPIDAASVTVRAPAEVMSVLCFSGPEGSNLQCDSAVTRDQEAEFVQGGLGPYEALTVVVAFPSGVVPSPEPILEERWTLQRAFTISPLTVGTTAVLGVAIFGLIWQLLWRTGRDRRWSGSPVDAAFGSAGGEAQRVPLFEGGPFPVEYAPPAGLRPGEIGALRDEVVHPLDVTATIIDLAARGYLTIEELEERKFLSTKTDWRLTRLKPSKGLEDFERILLDGLFEDGDEVKLSDLKTKFVDRLEKVKEAMYRHMVDQGWYRKSPEKTRNAWLGIGFLVLIVGAVLFGLAIAFTRWAIVPIPVILGGIALIAWHGATPARTPAGTAMARRVRGFERFISSAEVYRARFAEEMSLFYEYLPYAIVFGATEKWAKAFEGLGELPQPSWYTGAQSHALFNVAAFSDSMQSFAVSSAGTIASTPSSSGSSGFSGGGFSGGGGGGGGGGSW